MDENTTSAGPVCWQKTARNVINLNLSSSASYVRIKKRSKTKNGKKWGGNGNTNWTKNREKNYLVKKLIKRSSKQNGKRVENKKGSKSKKTKDGKKKTAEANSYAVGKVDRKSRFPIGDKIGLSYTVEKELFRSQLFRLRNPIHESRRKTRVFRRDSWIGFLNRKSFRILPHTYNK